MAASISTVAAVSDAQDNTADEIRVAGYAALALQVWRDHGISDEEIRTRYLEADEAADLLFERGQRVTLGYVAAPAKSVKDEIRRLMGE